MLKSYKVWDVHAFIYFCMLPFPLPPPIYLCLAGQICKKHEILERKKKVRIERKKMVNLPLALTTESLIRSSSAINSNSDEA